MSTANTWGNSSGSVGTLNGFFKEVYADKLENLIPDQVKILNMIKFMPQARQLGSAFHQCVILGLEHGVTFASSDDDAFNLSAPISGNTKDVQVKGSPAVLRSVMGLVAASRASGGDSKAFMDATKYLVANMLRSMSKKIEIECLYGQNGYGTVGAVAGNLITITTADYAPGIWAGAEGMIIEIRDASGAVSRGEATITAVNMETRVLTLSAALPGVVATDVIYHKTAYGNEFIGIHEILNKQTGTLFNINISQYNMFRANRYDAQASALSFTKLNLAAARAVEKGHEGKLVALVNPRGWANMLNDQASLRQYDGSYSREKAENGSQKLVFFSQNGEIEIVPSIYVKEGYAYLLSIDSWSRVGSQDISFKRPSNKDDFFRDLENSAGYELRLFTDQAIFCSSPAKNVLIYNIVNQE